MGRPYIPVSKLPRHRISKVLRLDYIDSKHRVHVRRSTFEPSAGSGPAFIELGLIDPMHPAECTVEMADQKGAKMKTRFRGEPTVDLLELSKAFWSKRS